MTNDTVPHASWRTRAALALFLANAGAVVLLWWMGSGARSFGDLAGELNAVGRIAGLVGTYLVLVQLVLRAHVPWLVDAFGKDALRSAHTRNAYVALSLLVAHAVVQTLAYAIEDRLDLVGELVRLVLYYDGLLLSIVGLLLLGVLTALSLEAVRRRIPLPTWRALHLYTYVAVALSVPHQLATGTDFVGAPLAVAYWWALYAVIVATIVVTRSRSLWRAAGTVGRQRAPALAFTATVLGLYLLVNVRLTPVRAEAPPAATATPIAPGSPAPARTAPPGPTLRIDTPASGVFDGEIVATPYGDARVRIIVGNGRLRDVEALLLPSVRKVSKYMSASVEPYLRARAIDAQSARIDVISGATYTSRAYAESLGSALRAAGLGD